ncbi:phosphoribosylformylglycinamidine cyclo-ligase [Alkaliphilus serpentinus]|uniref:Phosphoribosylformylglycinamidine cyclo-ligase n=1 Tax=Alkaliphilus serpentinus TaxID=1482731 RepID=A0A833HQP0_9FIRM|nr:phosphoribosylformylglycinamidine cyclo-ligase [Alkaliphilus serpentinus]KAB3532111.1 phosphoribosylformylglycinamidine cyclo-ligase [Alkaliphilus serpentinus]
MEKLTYRGAGVDVDEGQRAVDLMKNHVKGTFTPQVLTDIGGFGGLFALDLKNIKEPVLVSGTDGVGTKLKVAIMTDKHNTIGQDCVAMCVNDILCQGATPLFFLDYIATGILQAEKIAEIVSGIADGCKLAGCALIGGETAEMPGLYHGNDYDLAGFAVGLVDKIKIVDGKDIKAGDVIIGLPSSGIHSNGFSLVRKLLFEVEGYDTTTILEGFNRTLEEELLTPTKIYVKPILKLLQAITIKGMVHITGGGFYENIPRVLPEAVDAIIQKDSWHIPEIFNRLQKLGNIEEAEMYNTFNMGIGLMLVVDRNLVDSAISILKEEGENPSIIGRIEEGQRRVILC